MTQTLSLTLKDRVLAVSTIFIVAVQSLRRVQLFATPWTAACQASLSFTISQSLLKLMSIESVMPSNHLFPCGSDSKEFACNAGDPGLIPWSGRSPGGGNGNPPQYSCLENSMDRRAWWATVHGVTKSLAWLSTGTHTIPTKQPTEKWPNVRISTGQGEACLQAEPCAWFLGVSASRCNAALTVLHHHCSAAKAVLVVVVA